jgi:hypothetical protein
MTDTQRQQYRRIDQAIKAIVTPATQGFYTEQKLLPLLNELREALTDSPVEEMGLKILHKTEKRLIRELKDGPVALDGFISDIIRIEHAVAKCKGRRRYLKTRARLFYYGNRTVDEERPIHDSLRIATERIGIGARHVLGMD